MTITEHDLRELGFSEKRIACLRHLDPDALQEIYDEEMTRLQCSAPGR